MLENWDKLPKCMKNQSVKYYYDILKKKKGQLFLKRVFDFWVALFMLILLSPVLITLAIMIKKDSNGPIFFRQERVTQYGRKFRIFKFRTMMNNAENKGSQVTVQGDSRITKMGEKLRGCRLDELPQLINVLKGEMSFVGVRPEVVKYVKGYTPEMKATLLMPAGITSEASIQYKDEAELLDHAQDVDEVYLNNVLPEKMKYNLKSIEHFSVIMDVVTMFKTIFAVFEK